MASMKRRPMQGASLPLTDPVPWEEPVEGGELLEELDETFHRFVVVAPAAADAAAFWVLHAHALDAFQSSPILAVTSPEKRCGKTRVLELLEVLTPRALLASSVSPAALFRAVEKFRPTLLIDEADCYLGENEQLRGILNSGHCRRGARVIRTVGMDFEPRTFSTWGAKAIALIGSLPATLEDRAIILRMRRRAPGERIEPLRRGGLDSLEPLCRKAARWAQDNRGALEAAEPDIPAQLDDRAADSWAPLFAIAETVGHGWWERARQAAISLSHSGGEAENSVGIRLLSDLRDIFADKAGTVLPTNEIITALVAREERSWGEYYRGKPISPVQLARLLKRFEIGPRTIRLGETTFKGYELNWFRDAFARYLPIEPSHPSQTAINAVANAIERRHNRPAVTAHEYPKNPHPISAVTGVTAQAPATGIWLVSLAERVNCSSRARPRRKQAALEAQSSFFQLTQEQTALLERHGWELVSEEPPEGLGHA